ncbi:MAG: FliH/SctL family protein [Planctomycetota bacterium]|nr:FliH/SctL family protein [Planctomycetota bacterium]
MGVIKSAQVPTTLAAFSMADIEAAARNVLLRARQKAEQMIAAAQVEAESLKKQATEKGFIEGRKSGINQGMQEGRKSGHDQALAEHSLALSQLVQSLTKASTDFENSRDDLQTEGLREVIDLAAAIARRVTKRQGMIDPRALMENLKEAMSLVVHCADVRIAVNPAQHKTLAAELPNLRIAWPQLKHIELVEDGSVSLGGARIFSSHGHVDADLDVQLDRVIAELMPVISPPTEAIACT